MDGFGGQGTSAVLGVGLGCGVSGGKVVEGYVAAQPGLGPIKS